MRKRVVVKPWLPSPAGDLAHREQFDAVTRCCWHSILQESGRAYCTYRPRLGKPYHRTPGIRWGRWQARHRLIRRVLTPRCAWWQAHLRLIPHALRRACHHAQLPPDIDELLERDWVGTASEGVGYQPRRQYQPRHAARSTPDSPRLEAYRARSTPGSTRARSTPGPWQIKPKPTAPSSARSPPNNPAG